MAAGRLFSTLSLPRDTRKLITKILRRCKKMRHILSSVLQENVYTFLTDLQKNKGIRMGEIQKHLSNPYLVTLLY